MPQHSETRALPWTARQMYDLVADVAAFPEFLPWVAAARIRSVTDEGDYQLMLADLVVSFKVFRERFGSRVELREDPLRIDIEYLDGPFHHMRSSWAFHPREKGCDVAFHVDFEFRNRLLQGAAGFFFTDAMQRVVRAFETRAAAIYG